MTKKEHTLEDIRQMALDGTLTQAAVDDAAKNQLLYGLRRAVHYLPDGKKASNPSLMRALSDSQLVELWSKLLNYRKRGTPPYDFLSKLLQEEWGVLKDHSPKQIAKSIKFYERRVFGLIGMTESIPELREWSQNKAKIVKKVTEKVDGLKSLSELITRQMKRLDRLIEIESTPDDSGRYTIIHSMPKELQATNNLLHTYLKYQIELGVHKRQPVQVNVGLYQSFAETHKRIEQTVGTQTMVKATDNVLDMLQTQPGEFELIEFDEKDNLEVLDDGD